MDGEESSVPEEACAEELRADDEGVEKKGNVWGNPWMRNQGAQICQSEISTGDGKDQSIHSFYFDEKLRILYKEQINA